MNELMRKFWQILNHPEAVQIKFEVAKGLARFTAENTHDLKAAKQKKLEEVKSNKGQSALVTKNEKHEKHE